MAAPHRLTRSVLPIQSLMEPLAVTWNNATIVLDCLYDMIYYHHSGEWSKKETKRNGCKMPTPFQDFLIVQVINDKMIVVDLGKIKISSLDLNTWIWEECKPEGKPPTTSYGISSWVHKQKIYFFGGGGKFLQPEIGGSSQLFCYNYPNNCWERPMQAGDIPSPRSCHYTIISSDTVFLFGGGRNDLHLLNMEDMIWKKVHDDMPTEARITPNGQGKHTLTLISQSTAVLYGSYFAGDGHHGHDDSWLLNLNGAKQFKDPSLIWSKIPNHHLRFCHEAVLEPVSQSLWVMGGFDGNMYVYTSDLLKMSFNLAPLKDLAIDHVARRIDTEDQRLLANQLPRDICNEIENYRSKIGNVNICSAEGGCQVCQQN